MSAQLDTASPESPAGIAPVVASAVPTSVQELEPTDTSASPARGRGRPSKQKGNCTKPNCAEPEMCAGLCRRCYHQDYNTRKKTDGKDKDAAREGGDSSRSNKRQRRRSVSKGPFTTADNQTIDTPYIVEVAVNARTKCQVCKEKITREEVRIGVLRSKASNTTPGLCRWYHPVCFEPPPDFSLRRLHGRKKLGHVDRTSLKETMNAKKHKHHSREHSKDRSERSRSHARSSTDLTPTKSKKKHRVSKEKKHKTHKKDVAPQIYQKDSSSESSSYSDDDEFDDEEVEESYESSDSSGRDSGSSDDDAFTSYRRG